MHNHDRCPACHRVGTLIPLGARLDHPHRWLPWVSATTHLFLCDHCDALIETRMQTPVEAHEARRMPIQDGGVSAMIGGERVLAISAA